MTRSIQIIFHKAEKDNYNSQWKIIKIQKINTLLTSEIHVAKIIKNL